MPNDTNTMPYDTNTMPYDTNAMPYDTNTRSEEEDEAVVMVIVVFAGILLLLMLIGGVGSMYQSSMTIRAHNARKTGQDGLVPRTKNPGRSTANADKLLRHATQKQKWQVTQALKDQGMVQQGLLQTMKASKENRWDAPRKPAAFGSGNWHRFAPKLTNKGASGTLGKYKQSTHQNHNARMAAAMLGSLPPAKKASVRSGTSQHSRMSTASTASTASSIASDANSLSAFGYSNSTNSTPTGSLLAVHNGSFVYTAAPPNPVDLNPPGGGNHGDGARPAHVAEKKKGAVTMVKKGGARDAAVPHPPSRLGRSAHVARAAVPQPPSQVLGMVGRPGAGFTTVNTNQPVPPDHSEPGGTSKTGGERRASSPLVAAGPPLVPADRGADMGEAGAGMAPRMYGNVVPPVHPYCIPTFSFIWGSFASHVCSSIQIPIRTRL